MTGSLRGFFLAALVLVLIVGTGVLQSWNSALLILNMGLVSAIMALGVNLQWGFAGLFNVGVMGFVALGGLAVVLVSMPPVPEAWRAGGFGVLAGLALGALTIAAAALAYTRFARRWRTAATSAPAAGRGPSPRPRASGSARRRCARRRRW